MKVRSANLNDKNSEISAPSEAQVRRLARLTARRERYHPVVVGFVVGTVLAASAALLIAQNTQTVAFDWLWVSFDASLWAALLGSFLAGAIASPLVLIGVRAMQRRRRRYRELLESVGEEGPTGGSALARRRVRSH